jgi:RNA polymerase sigma-70 factor (ECF subfamily)
MELRLVRSREEAPPADRPERGRRPTDEELILQVQRGSREAFDEIVARFSSRIINFIYQIVGDRDSAEDLAQETFVRVYLHSHRYRDVARFSTWIFTIAANLSKNELRNRSRHPSLPLADEVGLMDNEGTVAVTLEDPRRLPDGETETEELRGHVAEAVGLLPPKYREVFVLREMEGFSYHEIARMARLPKGTVKSRINRARLRFRDEMQRLRGPRGGE